MLIRKINSQTFNGAGIDIQLVPTDFNSPSTNTFTIIIGKNGTFKSSCMRLIAEEFRNKDSVASGNVAFDSRPDRVIAISSTSGDKFTLARHNVFPEWLYRGKNFDVHYFYFGPKHRGAHSNRSTMKQLIDAIAFGTNSDSSRLKIRNFLSYIGLQPKLVFYLKESKRLAKMEKDKSDKQLQNIIKSRLQQNPSLARRVNQSLKLMKDTRRGREVTIDLEKDQQIAETLAAISILTHRNQLQIDDILTFKADGKGEAININDLSSGEGRLLLKSIALACTVTDNSLVLIDEPENSLHPEWQICYLENLQKAFEAVNGCHVVISTHSPHILSSANPNFSFIVPLEKSNNVSTGHPLGGSVYGWSVENILLDLFGLATTRNYYFEMKIRELLAEISKGKKSIRAKRILNELEQFEIQENDPLAILIEKAKKIVD